MEGQLAKKIILEGKEYDVDSLNQRSNEIMASVKNLDEKLADKRRLLAVLTRAKLSYIEEIKRDIVADKAGFDFLE